MKRRTYEKDLATSPILLGSYQAEKATIAGICNKHTWSAYAEPISILQHHSIHNQSAGRMQGRAHLSAMFPFKANEMAFINSVVFGTRANSVTPRNFSSIPESLRTISTTSTSNSVKFYQLRSDPSTIYSPAMIAYNAVHPSKTLALVVRLQEGASCPPCAPWETLCPPPTRASFSTPGFLILMELCETDCC